MERRLFLSFLLLVSFFSLACRQRADLVLHNGKIVTVDPDFRIAEALAVRGDRILAAGTNSEILKLAAPGAEQVDLQGKTVLPGLIDSFVHAPSAAMYEFDHTVPDMDTIQDVLNYIKGRAEAQEDGEWIVVSQVFVTRLQEQRFPTREELDRAAPRNPVVFRTGPDASLNSLALALNGIDRNFRIPNGQPGHIERDPKTGEPTGMVRNAVSFLKYEAAARTPTVEERLSRLKMLLADYNSVGITSIVDRNAGDLDIELFQKLRERGELTCRTFLMLGLDTSWPMEEIEQLIRQAAGSPLRIQDHTLWLRGVASFLDGGILTGSAYMLEPWGVSELYAIKDPNYRGVLNIEPEKLFRIAKLAVDNRLQFTVHARGDAAVHTALEAFDRINREHVPVRELRPSLTHASFLTLNAIQTMARLGVVANLQPPWLLLDGRALLNHFGAERLAYFHPYRSLLEHGVVAGAGSDHMQKIGSLRSTNPYNPFLGMWTTLARQPRRLDQPLRPEQRITREQAIRMYTANNAYNTFEENVKGSLERGRLADFIVLKQDILAMPEEEIKNIEVERTYLGGKLVYNSDSRSRAALPARGHPAQ